MNHIKLPLSDGINECNSESSFVIVGANGSGKSHLGAWIEKNNNNVLRISAQRALTVPDSITIKSESAAWSKVFYGNEKEANKGYKWDWDQASTTKLVNDYDSVLACVFARQNKENDSYVKQCRENEQNGIEKPIVPEMVMDAIISIWDSVFPHRSIVFEDAKVLATHNGGNIYSAKHMSDGERVAIYLISQCLVAPDGTTVVIDEPEIHLHRSIMYKLWDKIEEKCVNKTIVYISHDLDFAASRKEATKIWTRSFDGKKWDYIILDNEKEIPDSLLIEVLGSRKPILLVEGERGSYDNQLYPYLYENYNIIPCHNCTKVIEMTKAFNNEKVKTLHNCEIKGLIDRDYLSIDEIKAYESQNIFTLSVAEVENLYIIEDVVKIIAKHQCLDPIRKMEEVKNYVFSSFQSEYDLQIASICTKEIKHKLNCYNRPKSNKLEDMKTDLNNLVGGIDIDLLYHNTRQRIDQILKNNDYDALISVYNRKSLHLQVSSIMGLAKNEYPNLVLRLLKTGGSEIVEAMKKFVPIIN